jgi:hypothetical protein
MSFANDHSKNTLVTEMKVDITNQVQRLVGDLKKTPEWQELQEAVGVVNKARALLFHHRRAIAFSRTHIQQVSQFHDESKPDPSCVALVVLADALEHNENESPKEDRYEEAIGWIIGTLGKGYDDEETVYHIRHDLIEQGIMNEEGDMIDV